jgi:hypothetical protein
MSLYPGGAAVGEAEVLARILAMDQRCARQADENSGERPGRIWVAHPGN